MAALHFVERQLRNNGAPAREVRVYESWFKCFIDSLTGLDFAIEMSLEREGAFSIWFAKRHSASDIGNQASDQSTLF